MSATWSRIKNRLASKRQLGGLFGLLVASFLVALSLSALSSGLPVNAATAQPITGLAGKCLDVQGGQAVNRNAVQLYGCNSTAAQQWEQPGDGTLRNQGHCLDVQWGGKDSQTLVWLYECNGTQAQQWEVKSDGTIVNPHSGLCLDDQYGGINDRNPVWIYSCNATTSQVWAVVVPQVAAPAPAPKPAPTPAPDTSSSSGSGYTNVDGNHVQSPSNDPAGATAQCEDGTYSYSQNHRGTCSHHGGVARWL